MRDLTDLAAKADLAAREHVGGTASLRWLDANASARARSAAGSTTRTPPTADAYTSDIDSSILGAQLPSTAISSARRPPSSPWASRGGNCRLDFAYKRLQFDEQGPPALHRRHDHRARRAFAAVGEEQPARVGHAGQAVLPHLEQPQLTGGAEAVFERAQEPQRVVPLALERQHGVDEMLEGARARPARRPW